VYPIETTDLTKYYSGGKVQALEGVNIQVEGAQIFSLLGPNGAGKTTLMKILLGVCLPTRGNAKILGREISNHLSHSRLGYLAENHRFPDFLSASQVLYYYGKMSGVDTITLKERIPRLLGQVKLEKWEKEKIRKFSKGMLQRLGIAQALLNDPDILFLDEPTDGIDPIGRREVRDLLLALKNEGKIIFLNSHLLSEVERVSDEVAILKNGRLIQKGRVEDFIAVKDTYEIKVPVTAEALAPLCQRLQVELRQQNGKNLIEVDDAQHLNHFIDALREKKVIIQAIIPHKITLEDFFIEVIEEKEGKLQ
jgi:ABC-2 type transport system ATP-binding protein